MERELDKEGEGGEGGGGRRREIKGGGWVVDTNTSEGRRREPHTARHRHSLESEHATALASRGLEVLPF